MFFFEFLVDALLATGLFFQFLEVFRVLMLIQSM